MVELAVLEEPGLEGSAFELEGLCYTIDTVKHFHRRHPDDRLFLILGSDSLAAFHRWRRWRDIAALAELVVLARPGWNPEHLSTGKSGEDLPEDLRRLAASDRVHRVENPPVEVSSTGLRRALAMGGRRPPGIPELVFRYLKKYALYESRP